MALPPAAQSLWKSVDKYKLSTGDNYTAAQQLALHNDAFTGYFVDFTFDIFKFETRLGSQLQHVSFLSLYIHTDKDEFVGFSRTAIRGKRAWVAGLAISPPFRGQGIGSLLLTQYLELLREKSAVELVQLEVFKVNAPALKLYQRIGFSTNFDLQDYCFNDVKALASAESTSLTVHCSDQLDLTLPWLQHRILYSWQREFSSLINSNKSPKQYTVLDNSGKLVVALAVETSKEPARINGFAFESGQLSSVDLSRGIRISLEGTAKAAEIRMEPDTSELIKILEAMEGCTRDPSFEEHHMIFPLDRP